jgi:hypothetical protein
MLLIFQYNKEIGKGATMVAFSIIFPMFSPK